MTTVTKQPIPIKINKAKCGLHHKMLSTTEGFRYRNVHLSTE
jgi:hypothetical protein